MSIEEAEGAMMDSVINISSYRFVFLEADTLPELRVLLKEQAELLDLKGTVLLSTEGINLFVAGTESNIEKFRQYLNQHKAFTNLWFKKSESKQKPFTRMLVRLKKEIIAMGEPAIKPAEKTAPYISPKQLQAWYEQGEDMIVLDTRNDYEIKIGAFEKAVVLDIHSFREFPEALAKLPEAYKKKKIVTYCTGGIRCEKAAQYMLDHGFESVYQLEGGILNYFEQCAGAHYDGECFVFDKRVALDSALEETKTKQCFACRAPLVAQEQNEDEICPHCHKHCYGKRFYAHQPKQQAQAE